MATKVANRVRETTITTGTGTVNLLGAVNGYQTFVAGIGTTNVTYYCIADQVGTNWEVGKGTVTSGAPDTLSRSTVFASSNAGSLVNFGAGVKDVICTGPSQMWPIIAAGDVFYGVSADTIASLAQPGDTRNNYLVSTQGAPFWKPGFAGNTNSANQATFNSTATNIIGCSFKTGIGESWAFQFFVPLRATAGTTGCGFNLTVPTSTVGAFTAFGNTGAVTTFTEIYTTAITTNTAKSFCTVITTDLLVIVSGEVHGSTVAGTVQLQGQSGAVGTTIQIDDGAMTIAAQNF